jgi:hypothetical protein
MFDLAVAAKQLLLLRKDECCERLSTPTSMLPFTTTDSAQCRFIV